MIYTKLLIIFYTLLPVFFALSVTSDVDVHIGRIIILIIFGVFLTEGLWMKRIKIPQGALAAALIFFLAVIFSSFFTSNVPGWTVRKVIFLCNYALLIPLTYNALLSHGLRPLMRAVCLGGILASVIMLAQFMAQFIIGHESLQRLWVGVTTFFLGEAFGQVVLNYNSWFVNIGGRDLFRAIGIFPDPHVAAYYTGMILPFTMSLAITSRGRYRMMWCSGLVIIACANALTFSRGGEIGVIFGLIVALGLMWGRLAVPLRHTMIACAAVGIMVMVIPANPLTQRILSSFDAADTSNTSRIEIWSKTLEIWSQRPLLGTGLGASPKYYEADAQYRTPIYAHNIYLDIGVELGVVGLLLFVAMIFFMYRHFYMEGSWYSLCAIISVTILLIHSMFDTPLFSVHVLPIIFFLVGLALYYAQKKAVSSKGI